MNQTCKVCGEPAAGFHFGAFTCEGCKSFFGRSYNNLSSISECKNNGKCIIDKKNRTTCKACRLRKCYTVGMSKGGSRYGRRSNWFKIHCLLQEQQQQAVEAAGKAGVVMPGNSPNAPHGFGADMAAAAAAAAAAAHQQRNAPAHMQAQHMGGLLGYPTYLPDMAAAAAAAAAGSPFARHPADAAAAAAASALPFFSMMNSLPSIGSPQSAFQLPPHLLFSGYHHPAAAAAAADAAYRSEMYKHRQSVDSAASGESQRFTPTRTHSRSDGEERVPSVHSTTSSARQSPVDVVVDEDRHSVHSHQSHHSIIATTPVSHTIHNPIAIRATPTQQQQQQQQLSHSPLLQQQQQQQPLITTVAATTPVSITTTANTSPEPLSFAAKMESLSPVSVCSIGHETAPHAAHTPANDQDCPMDLSMKTSRSSVHSPNTSAGDCDAHSDASSSELLCVELRQDTRRKFYQLNSESSEATNSSLEHEAVKRQKLALDDGSATGGYGGFAVSHNANAMRGIFVCV